VNLRPLCLTTPSAEGTNHATAKASMSKQKQPRRLPDAGVGMFGAEPSPSRSAPIAPVVSSALCGQVASRQAHADNESFFRFTKSFSQKRESQSVHIGEGKIPRMPNSGQLVAERYSHLCMKTNCSIHSQIGGALCGLFA